MEKLQNRESSRTRQTATIIIGAATLVLAGRLAAERLAEGPENCVQSTDDIAPAVNVLGCIEDITESNK